MAALLCLSVTQTAQAEDSPNKFGIQLGGGYGIYDMGDVELGVDYLLQNVDGGVATREDGGIMGNLALIYRPGKHQIWEIGYNPLFDVENLVEFKSGDSAATGQLLMHANEFYAKAGVTTDLAKRLQLALGLGVAYYNCEMQIQDEFNGRFYYDAVGRAFGLIGTVGLELGLSKRVGLFLTGGGRWANAANFSYESSPGNRTSVPVLGGTRAMEVNLSGGFAQAGFRFYFDPLTKPVDFTR
ncbi:hypothetical protein IT157_07435 [bacterium]|nr:hypothetical protein [bacterium]